MGAIPSITRGRALEHQLSRTEYGWVPDELDDLAVVVADGGDGEHVPEGRAVLAVVEQAAAEAAAGLDGVPDLGDLVHVRVGALQEAAVAADHVLGGVAGHGVEAGAGVDDGAVRARGVGDHERLLQAGQRVLELPRHPRQRVPRPTRRLGAARHAAVALERGLPVAVAVAGAAHRGGRRRLLLHDLLAPARH